MSGKQKREQKLTTTLCSHCHERYTSPGSGMLCWADYLYVRKHGELAPDSVISKRYGWNQPEWTDRNWGNGTWWGSGQ